ncbi:DUF2818 family protein [Plasticicumulans lactativorans]|uniref:DUF2818 family protein n=1 Tax=Plasticicumulans lactativorans TaxID=1133106 RepID=UPI0010481010|nr:DUF2818 family protein [Plasticicumulans lactativorans]
MSGVDIYGFSWLLVALVCLNFPWVSDRALLLWSRGVKKSSWHRWVEWAFLLILCGVLGIILEYRSTGARHPQDWEFYAVLLSLGLVASLPGFVFRYQWLPLKRRG